jgi:hypothetical protein
MLSLRAELPDIDGALVENVLNDMIDRMRPAKGEPWATRAQRGADAMVELCRLGRNYDPDEDPDAPLRDAYRPDFVVTSHPKAPSNSYRACRCPTAWSRACAPNPGSFQLLPANSVSRLCKDGRAGPCLPRRLAR